MAKMADLHAEGITNLADYQRGKSDEYNRIMGKLTAFAEQKRPFWSSVVSKVISDFAIDIINGGRK
jgi:hypothetical protein